MGAPGWECERDGIADFEVLAAAKGKEEGKKEELMEDSGGVCLGGDGDDGFDEVEWDR
jgi:hypothetical protein